MKKTRIYLILPLLFTFIITAAIIFTAGDNGAGNIYAQHTTKEDILSRFQKDKTSITRTHEEMTNLMANIVDDVKKRNLKFRVELNEMMKYHIKEITGNKPPSRDEIKRQEAEQKRQEKLRKKEEERKKQEQMRQEELEKKKRDDEIRKEKNQQKQEEMKRQEEERRRQEEINRQNQIDKSELFNQNVPSAIMPALTLAAFTWKDSGKTTAVKYQGTCGSCWAFTSTAVYETNYKIKNNRDIDLSEQFILDCAKDSRGSNVGSCNGGWYSGVFDFFMQTGALTESERPYRGKDGSCTSASSKSPYRVIKHGYIRRDAGIPSVKEMKEAIAKYGAIATSVKVTPAFQAYAGGIFDEHTSVTGQKDVNHAVTVVGWDDNKRAYLVENSWGPQWGEKGFVWIEYGCNNIGYGASWVVVSVEE